MENLSEFNLTDSPFESLKTWHKLAIHQEDNPYVFTLGTVDEHNRPQSRSVLLKGIEDDGILFVTHYTSNKWKHIEKNSYASFTFYWHKLGTQVTGFGKVEKMPRTFSENYFNGREFESKIATIISKQSEPIESRHKLHELFRQGKKEFSGKDIPCPENWGGVKIRPIQMEFFIYGEYRLNDRVQFKQNDQGLWTYQLLMP